MLSNVREMSEQGVERVPSPFGIFNPPTHIARQWELSARSTQKRSIANLERKLEAAAYRRQVSRLNNSIIHARLSFPWESNEGGKRGKKKRREKGE